MQKGDPSTNSFELGVGFTPIGTYFDIKAALSGEDMNEENLSPFYRGAGLIPLVSEFRKITKGWKFTKSNLKLGQEMHKAYHSGKVGKGFRLLSGKRIDT